MCKVNLSQELLRPRPQASPCLRKEHSAGVPQEQGLSEFRFQRGYLLRKGGLRDPDLQRGTRQTAGLRAARK